VVDEEVDDLGSAVEHGRVKDVVPVRHGGVHIRSGRHEPADGLEVVAPPARHHEWNPAHRLHDLGVGARLQQGAGDVGFADECRVMKRSVLMASRRFGVGAGGEQELDRLSAFLLAACEAASYRSRPRVEQRGSAASIDFSRPRVARAAAAWDVAGQVPARCAAVCRPAVAAPVRPRASRRRRGQPGR